MKIEFNEKENFSLHTQPLITKIEKMSKSIFDTKREIIISLLDADLYRTFYTESKAVFNKPIKVGLGINVLNRLDFVHHCISLELDREDIKFNFVTYDQKEYYTLSLSQLSDNDFVKMVNAINQFIISITKYEVEVLLEDGFDHTFSVVLPTNWKSKGTRTYPIEELNGKMYYLHIKYDDMTEEFQFFVSGVGSDGIPCFIQEVDDVFTN